MARDLICSALGFGLGSSLGGTLGWLASSLACSEVKCSNAAFLSLSLIARSSEIKKVILLSDNLLFDKVKQSDLVD